MIFRAVLFDLDGTLLDSLADLSDSMNAVLKKLGFPVHEPDAYRYFVGDGMEILCRRSLPENHRDPTTVAACLAGMKDEYGRRWHDKTRPYPGIDPLLDRLGSRGIKTAVLSNKPDDFTRLTVEHLFPKRRFDAVFGERPGIARKPDPAAALEIARSLGVGPAEVVYLGDTAIDMKTAAAAGMYPVGALWGFRPKKELVESGAVLVIARPGELLNLF